MGYRDRNRSRTSSHGGGISAIEAPARTRLIASICGMEGGGKTDFLLTCPRPLYVAYMDPNTEDILGGKKNVYGQQLKIPAFKLRGDDEDGIKAAAEELVDEFRQFALAIMEESESPTPATVAVDTGTELWDTVLLADFGRTTRIQPRDRGGANLFWRNLFSGMKAVPGLNFVVTHRVKQKWGTKEVRGRGGMSSIDQPLEGEYDRVGHRETGNLVNVEVLLMHDPDKGEELRDQFGVRVMRCTQRPLLIGTEEWGVIGKKERRVASFPWLATQVFPETSWNDWHDGSPWDE